MDTSLISVIGMVGAAGCVGVGSTLLRENYKEKEAEKEKTDESNEQEKNENTATSFPKDSMFIDKNKLKDILIQASYPTDKVDEFVNLIATQAKAKEEKVVVEEIAPEPVKTEKSSKKKSKINK